MKSLVIETFVAILQLQSILCLDLKQTSLTAKFDEKLDQRIEKWTGNDFNISFLEWHNLKMKYGALCRGDYDCDWIDENLYCNQIEHLDNEPNVGIISN